MLQELSPNELVLARLADREFAREWLKAQDDLLAAKDKRVAELEAALRPFAEAWLAAHYTVDSEHWERAHALIERKE